MLSRFLSFSLALFFLLIPFHAFLVTGINALFFDPHTAPPFFINAWKEVFLFSLLCIVFVSLIPHWRKVIQNIDILDILIILFSFWAIVIGYLETDHGWSQILLGAKYDLFPFWFFLGFRKCTQIIPFNLTPIFKIFFWTGCVVIVFGILQFFLPSDFLVHFGYSSDPNHFTPDKPLAYCQQISYSGYCRLQSFASGPNQLASFLLFFLPFLGMFIWKGEFLFLKKDQIQNTLQNTSCILQKNIWWIIVFIMGIFVLLGTFSRSALLGAFFASIIGIYFLFQETHIPLKIILGALFSPFIVVGIISIFYPPFFNQFLVRISSTQGHYERSLDGIRFILENPWGLGLGDAGPASSRFAEQFSGFLPESWYLQIALETGILGIFLFLGIIFFAGQAFLKSDFFLGKAFFIGLVGISVMGIFLHSWESSTLAYSFWGLGGLVIGNRYKTVQ